MDVMFAGLWFLLNPLLWPIYFLPVIVAVARRHKNALAIFALTLLLGWTTIVWIAALVWSLTDNVRPRETNPAEAPSE